MKDSTDRRATITKAAKGEGKFIRRSGGKGQYGHVVVKVEPNGGGKGIAVSSEISDSAIPEEYVMTVTDAIREALDGGMVIGNPAVDGYPVVDIVVHVINGSSHETDSSEVAFKLAAIFAIKDAVKRADPIAIE